MTKIVLVRHGEALCNVDRTVEAVATCRGLTPLGVLQGIATAERFEVEGFKPDVLLSSPIRRAAETATLIAERLNVEPVLDSDLEEVRPGEAEGMTWDQYFAFYGTTEGWQPSVPFAPGAEAWTTFAARVANAIDRVARSYAGATVLLVTHGGVVDASLFHFFGLDPEKQPPIDFSTSNASITEWERARYPPNPLAKSPQPEVHRWRLGRYNDAAHVSALRLRPPT